MNAQAKFQQDAAVVSGGLINQSANLKRLNEARQLCQQIISGRDLAHVARGVEDPLAYGLGSMIAKLFSSSMIETTDQAFDFLEAFFASESINPVLSPKLSRRTAFESLQKSSMISPSATIREAKPAGTLPNITEISRVIETYHRINLTQIKSSARSRNIVEARFIMIWVMRNVCGHSLTYIGEQLGNRDHTSILNGVNRMNQMREADKGFRNEVDNICDESDILALRRQMSVLLSSKPALRKV